MPSRNTKIVATLGPSSSSREKIRLLAEKGVNVFRLNMSHGKHADIAAIHRHIRSIETEIDRPIAILGDLQGPKLRCGLFENNSETLLEGQKFRFDLEPHNGSVNRVQLPHPEIFQALEKGSILLVNDGVIRLMVETCSPTYAECVVLVGGEISNRKGVNVPSVVLPLSSLSRKDRDDLEFLCQLGIDWLALSFVQRAQDVDEARKLVSGRARILSKIEKPAAIDAFDEILAVSDAIMIARGDLGVELPVYKLPSIQKHLVRKCREAGKPVIVATQMLESMVIAPVPTRAEVSDVATAIFEGADAIMLSAETASGHHPVEAVATMVDVANDVESDFYYRSILEAGQSQNGGASRNPLTRAAREIAESGEVDAICCFTQSGSTAISQSRERPMVPIIALTPVTQTARYLCLVWGIRSCVIEPVERFKCAVAEAVRVANLFSIQQKSGRIALTAGVPVHRSGATNILRIAALDGTDIHQED